MNNVYDIADSIRDVLHKNTSLLDFASNVSGCTAESWSYRKSSVSHFRPLKSSQASLL